ncbi:MAG: AI-2E family transporter [Actinobacteria bacterium]|nr:AI-2E family transporter [Actinomycetota bacterium]
MGTDGPDATAPADADPGAGTGTPPPLVRERRRRGDRLNLPLAATVAVGLAAGLLLADLVGAAVTRLNGLIVTLIVSLFLSFAMEPAVQWLSQRGVRRGAGTFIVFLVAGFLLVGFVAAMAPLIVDQIRNLAQAGPDTLGDLADQARNLPGDIGPPVAEWLEEQRSELPGRVPDFAGRLATGAAGVGSTLAGMVVQFLTMLLVTFYLVADGPRFRRTLVGRLRPDSQREFLQVWELAIAKTGGYVYSRLLTAVASTVFHVVVFTVVGLPYPVALGVWVGIISSLIPVVGTYLAGALPLVIALSSDPIDAVWVLVAIVLYQQVENYLVAPRITAATMELHPAIAFVSVLVGGALLGAPGALLALPATAIAAALASAYGERHEVMSHGLLDPEARRRSASREGQLRVRGE